MSGIIIEHHPGPGLAGSSGRLTARLPGRDGVAELTWTRIDAGTIRADHTEAPDSLRGTGAAAALVAELVATARAEGRRIRPACSYVRAQADRHPDWQDVIAAG